MSEQGPNGWPKSNLLKSTPEIIFVTTTLLFLKGHYYLQNHLDYHKNKFFLH
mgnify:CR=1 FL=1